MPFSKAAFSYKGIFLGYCFRIRLFSHRIQKHLISQTNGYVQRASPANCIIRHLKENLSFLCLPHLKRFAV